MVDFSESVVRQAPWLENYQKDILGTAQAINRRPITIPEMVAAGLDDLSVQAMETTRGLSQYEPYLMQGAGAIGQGISSLQAGASDAQSMLEQAAQQVGGSAQTYDPSSAAAFMNPYQQQVTKNALDEMKRRAEIQQRDLAAKAVTAGAFGGSRQGIMETEQGRNLAEMQGRLTYEDLRNNYTQAQNASQTAFGNQQNRQQGLSQILQTIGASQNQGSVNQAQAYGDLGARTASLAQMGQSLLGTRANLENTMGQVAQTQAQRENDARRNTSMQQLYEPAQRNAAYADIFKPNIGSGGGVLSAVAPTTTNLADSIGAAAMGWGLPSLFSSAGASTG